MRSRRWRLSLVAVIVLLACGLAWVGWQVRHVNQDLSAAVADADQLQSAVATGDDAATSASLAALQVDSQAAADRTGGLTWSVLTRLPAVGDDARGVQVVSDVIADLSRDGLPTLTTTARDLDAIVPRSGAIPLRKVMALQQPVSTGAEAFGVADRRLAGEDPSQYVDRLAVKYRDLAHQVSQAADALRSADTAVRLLPAMLGADGPRSYLLVSENNAEIRATGGLPGAVSLVHTSNGKVEMAGQVASNSFGETAEPVLPLTAAERLVYGDELGTYFLDANFTPDFPRASALWRARWEQVYPDRVDGVVSIDPVALSYLLEATGPVEVGDLRLTADNAVDELLHQVYRRYEDPADQDVVFRAVARGVFDRVAQGVDSPRTLLTALARGAEEGRIYVHDFDPAQQAELSGSRVAGELVVDPDAPPQVGVYLNDNTGSKMSYFLRYDVGVDATSCEDGVQGLSGRAQLTSEAPADAADLPAYITGGGVYGTSPGSQQVSVNLYGPVGGSVTSLRLDGRPVEGAQVVVDRGRPVVTVAVLLRPRAHVELTWTMTTGPGQADAAQVTTTPSIERGGNRFQVPSACTQQ